MAEPPDRMWWAPPARLVPISPPPISHRKLLVHLGLGGCGEEVGEGTQHPAYPWPTPSLLPLRPKLLQTRLGASVTVGAACLSQHKESAPGSAIT